MSGAPEDRGTEDPRWETVRRGIMAPTFLVGMEAEAARKSLRARITELERDRAWMAEKLLDYIGGPCDDPAKNPHVDVWCISHQEKRCTGTADYERARALAATTTDPKEAP